MPQISELPNSLALVAAVFKEQGYQVKGVVNTFKESLEIEDFLAEADAYKPDVVGISMLTMQVCKTYALIGELKKRGYPVIVGGTHATACDIEVVDYGADVVVRNEGEETLRCLLRGDDKQDILGITYRAADGSIVRNPPRSRVADLACLPTPDFTPFDITLFDHHGFPKGMHRIFTSRGCPGSCTFCDSRVFGKKVTYMPIKTVMDEIRRRSELYGIRQFVVDDDCFTVRRKHVAEFCEEIQKITPKITWQMEGRVDMMTPPMAKMLKDAGCYQVTFGIESGDDETLRRTKKGVTVAQNIRAAKMAHDAGLLVDAYIMFGFPWETVRSLDNTLNMIHELWDTVHLFNGSGSLTPFPGTELYNEYAEGCGFRGYWLNPRYQDCGQSLYQNAANPYAVSTLSQRYLYDDTYIQEGFFFKYTPEFTAKMAEVAYEIGRHNLESMYPGRVIKQKAVMAACTASRAVYSLFPNLEKGIGKMLLPKTRPAIEERRFDERGNINAKG